MSRGSVVTTAVLPLTAAQTEVWTAQHLLGDRTDFVISLLVEITGPLDLDRACDVIRSVIADADALHVRFDFSGPEPVQYRSDDEWSVGVVDLRTAADPMAEAKAWIAADIASADTSGARDLFATALLRLGDEHVLWHQRYHHGIVDGFGMSIIFNEVRARYADPERGVATAGRPEAGRSNGGAWALEPLVVADAEYRASEGFRRDRDYWLDQMADAPEPPVLLPDVPDTGAAVTERVSVPIDRLASLYDVAETEDVRRTRLAPAVWIAYLSAVTGRHDLVVSLPSTARVGRRARTTPFMASTILPVRLRLSPSMTVADVARELQRASIGAVRHGRFRGEDIARELRDSGDRMVHGPGINVLMVEHGIDIGGSPAHMHSLQTGPVRDLDVTVTGGRDDEPLVFDLRSRPGAHDALIGHRDRFEWVLDQVLAQPDRTLSSLSTMSEPDLDRLLHTLNDTAEPSVSTSVPALFAAQVAATPDAVAVVLGERTLTFTELSQRVHQLAHALLDAGLPREGVVAVSMPRSIEMVVGVLAAMVAGGAFVPLDPDWPVDRRERVQQDADTRVVLTGAGDEKSRWTVDLDDWQFGDRPTSAPDVVVHGSQLAYVIFTSGSTGTPKGAMIRHEAICARMVWQRDRVLGFGPGDASLFKAPLSFDISVNEILLPLLSGGTLVIAEPGGERDGLYLLDVISRRHVTFVYLVSSMLDALLALDTDGSLSGLRHVWCGGEVLTPELFARFRSRLGTTLYHGYGPAEATIGVSHVIYTGDAPRIATSIGRPNPNTRLYVLDSLLRPVPVGVGGELYAGGFLLGRGYVGAPDMTASRFVADPFGPAGARLYRTGDRARWAEDGTLDFLGRVDNQVKIRGMRLELEEVEAALGSCPGVRRAAVDVRRTGAGAAFLAAWVVPDGAALTPEVLRSHCARVLPEYMVPSTYVVLDAFPTTANGKVDRRALPDPEQVRGDAVAPRTERERVLCEVMASALGVENVGVTDDFFALGGDSIVAITVVAQARERGLAIGPRDVFTLRTAEAIAGAAPAELVTVDDDPVGEVVATPIVARTLEHGGIGAAFHQTASVALPPGTDPALVCAAVELVVAHHPALRAVWSEGLTVPADTVSPEFGTGSVADTVARLDPTRPGGMVAVSLEADTLILSVHHLVVDGVSWRILLGDLLTALGALSEDRTPTLPPVTTSIRRWASLVDDAADAGHFDHELPWWREVLTTSSDTVGARTLTAADRLSATHTVTTPADVTAALLTDVATAYRTGPTEVLLVALARTLASWDGYSAPSVVVDVEGHGRDVEVVEAAGVEAAGVDLTRTVGWFTTVRPVALPTGPDPDADVLLQIRDSLRSAPASGVGYGALRYLRREPALAEAAAPSVLLNYLGRSTDVGVSVTGGSDPDQPAAHALTIDVIETGGQLVSTLRWVPGVVDDSIVDAWTAALDRVAGSASSARRTSADFPLAALGADDVAALPDDVEDVLPLTAVQDGIYFHSTFGDTDPYVVGQVVEIGGPVDSAVLRTALEHVVARHASLRTSFRPLADGRVVQVVHRTVDVPFTVSDSTVDEVLADHAGAGMDLGTAPLVRYTLVRHDETRSSLVQSIHHIVADGWSIPIMLREMLAHYGDTPALPAVTAPAAWVRHLAERDIDASARVWRAALAGVRESVPVPAFGAAGSGTASVRVDLSSDVTAVVSGRARDAAVTQGSLLHGAWGLALARATGRRDVVFGSTVSGRSAPVAGIESMVGLFIDTIPARWRLRADDTVASAVQRWQQEQADLLDHHHVGVPTLRRVAGVDSLFDSLVVVENYPLGDTAIADPSGTIALTGIRVEENSPYPLTLMVIPGDRLTLELKYDAALVSAAMAQSMLDTVVAVATAPADTLVSAVMPTDRPAVVDAPSSDSSTTLVDLLEVQRRTTPNGVALVHGEESLTYAELHLRAERVAAGLRERGAGPGSVVAVALPRSIDLVVALLAVVRSGAAYLPLDPGYPAERLAFMIEDAHPAAVIDGDLAPFEAEPTAAPGPAPADAAYVIYTSGSTGRPKGVVVPHSAIVPRLEWMRDHTPLAVGTRVLQKTPSSFDVSVSEFFGPLVSGATLVLADPDAHRDTARLVEVIRAQQITWVHFVPSMLDAFLTDPDVATCTSLRVIVCSGEALSAESARRVGALLPHVRLDNLYGPTEAAVDVTAAQGVQNHPGDAVPIGSALPAVGFRVLDGWLSPVGPDVPGELYLAGPQLARGYLRRPGLTSTRFVAGPDGERLYRTGDIVRWRDGALDYLGRADTQVKVRGFRIELGEIDAALRSHPSVDRAATVVRTDRGTAQIAAFVVGSVDEAALRSYLADRLPEHMVPTTLSVVADLPTGPSGKLDRAALLAAVRADTPTTTETGSGPVALLCTHFHTVLGGAAVGEDDDFFARGGDSILAIRLVNLARGSGLEISARDVFEKRTPRALAEVARVESPQAATVAESGVGEVRPLPVVHRLSEWSGSTDRFNQSLLLVVPAPVDKTTPQRTVDALVQHHDSLRLVLTRHLRGVWTTAVRPDASVTVHRVHAVDLDESAFADLVARESDAATDRLAPEAGAVLEVVWFDRGSEPGRLLLVAHHLVVDGVSWGILVEDLALAWIAHDSGQTPTLDRVRTSLREYGRLLDESAHSPARLAELDHWIAVTVPGGALITGRPPVFPQTPRDTDHAVVGQGDVRTVDVSSEVTAEVLGSVPALVRGDVTDVVAAALRLALTRWSVDRDVLVDLERHGRSDAADLSRTTGWFTSIAPVRLRPGTDPVTVLAETKEALRAAPDGGLGYGLLRYGNARTAALLARGEQSQILLNYLGRVPAAGSAPFDRAPETVRTDPDADMGGPYRLVINAHVTDGAQPTLSAQFAWSSAHLSSEAVTSLTDEFRTALGDLAEAARTHDGPPILTPSDVPLVDLTPDELTALTAQGSVETVWPLTPLQEGLVFESLSAGERDIYTAQFALDFDHRLDLDRLRSALAGLQRRHPQLRAGFTQTAAGVPVQVVSSSCEVPVREAHAGDDDEAERWMQEDRDTPFDLSTPPLWRVLVLHLDGGRDRLVINRQFLVWDGWSNGVVVGELLARYENPGLPAPADTAFERYLTWLAERDRVAARTAWATAMAGLDEPTLVAHRAAPPVGIPLRRRDELDASTTAALVAATRQRGVTLNAVVTAALALAISSATGRTDVVFGITVAGRPPEVEGLDTAPGMFLSTVPVRTVLDPRENVDALVRRVQGDRVEAMEFDHLGLAEIIEVSPHRTLFDTLCVVQNFVSEDSAASLNAAHGVAGTDSIDHTNYPLTVVVTPGARIAVTVEYRPEAIDVERVDLIADEFTRLVAGFATEGSRSVLPALPRLDRQVDEVPDLTVTEMLLRTAQKDPDAIALVAGSEHLTYAGLAGRVEGLARVLLGRGAGPETVVALALPRGLDMVVALFAVLRTGAAYLPLELDHPDARIHALLDDARPLCTVTTEAVGRRLSGRDGIVVLEPLHDESPLTAAELGAFAPGTPHRLDHPAYVIYTSGSTGTPKGVVTPYRGLTNMQLNHRSAIFDPVVDAAHGRTLRIAHTVSFAFDMSWEELLWLVEGHEVHVADEVLRRDADALVRYIDEERIDVINVTPTYASLLLETGLLDGHRPALVLLGGEAVGDDVWSALRSTDGVLGYNLYGPTEYTINTLGAGTDESETPTVGLPIRATEAHVLDGWLRPVPDGVAGELYIAGAGLARGYAGRFGLTADRFVANPFGTGERMYRTGDLVRRRVGTGLIDYLGRTDDQVKIRGHRVELGEVASVVSSVAGVRRAAVVTSTGPGGLARLIAYVDTDADAESVRAACAVVLPDYMVPTVVLVSSFPMTVNGKLDVAALPAPDESAVDAVPPRTEVERLLCNVFDDVLGRRGTGIHDDFFDLGGHSLLATRVVGRARTALGTELSVRDLFAAPTVAGLAALVGSRGDDARPALRRYDRPDVVPMSAAQQRLWLLHQLNPDSAAYNFPIVLPLPEQLDEDAFRLALADVVERHESLRTVFGDADGVLAQHVLTDASPEYSVHEGDAAAVVAEMTARPFDLRREIPIRAALIRNEDTSCVVVLVLHHITTDEWSDRPLLADLMAAYAARLSGDTDARPPLPVQYADYTLWQADLLGDAADPESLAGRQLAYWQSALAGAPDEIELATDRPRPPRPSHRGSVVRRTVDPETVRALRTLARSLDASVFMTLHAASAVLLHRITGSDDIVLGAPVAGRGEEGLDQLVGFFVNTLVLRTAVDGRSTLQRAVEEARSVDLEAFAHADVPFDAVVARVAPERSLSRNPLFQVMISHHTGPLGDGDAALMTPAKFDLVFNYTEDLTSDRLVLELEYAEDLFDASTAEAVTARQLAVLDALATDATAVVDDVDIFLPTERDDVLRRFNDTARAVPEESLFESYLRWVETTPDAIAVVDETTTWTYADLHEHVLDIAAELQRRGVGPEAVVAVAVPRSVWTIAATMGVLAVGAAYLPLDLKHPADRLEYMVTDSGATLALTSAAATAQVPSAAEHVLVEDIPPSTGVELVRPASLELAAYVIYTSGSTGRPKGVVVPHEGISSLVATAEDRMRLTTGSVVLQFASVGFDVAVFELAMALCTGSRLVIVPDDARVAGPELTDFCAEHGVTHAIIPPSLMAALPPGCALPEGCTVLVGTETVPPAVISAWSEHLNLLAAYGLTEATVNNTLWQARPGWTSSVPIGVPDPNERAYVLDDRLRPVPVGVSGELYIAGRGLARGYLGQPGLSAHRFVPDVAAPGGRMYRTGDRARWRADGNLDFLGRVDDQIKVRGFRIEPGEIMAAMASFDGVDQTAVVVHESSEVSRLVGYVTGRDDLTGAAVRTHAATVLPDYMVPTLVVVVDGTLPLTPNGKLDRAALPQPEWSSVVGGRAPTTDVERALVRSAAAVLGLDELGTDDDFFALGGHSMAAMQWVSAVRAELDVDISVRDVFEASTVRALAERLADRGGHEGPHLTAHPDRPDVVPLSPMQETRLQNGHVVQADHALVLELPDVDTAVLAAAVGDVAERHEPLHSVLVPGEGSALGDPVALETVDVGTDDIRRRAYEIAQEPLDLTQRPGLRIMLLQNDSRERIVLLVMHYWAVDEWSVVPLLTDLMHAAQARSGTQAPEFTPLPLRYSDVARWAVARREADDSAITSWRETLDGVPSRVSLPIALGESGFDAVAIDIDVDVVRALRSIEGAGLVSVLHAAFAFALTDLGAGEDLAIATMVAGRDDESTHAMVGAFADVVPIRTRTGSDLATVARRVQAETVAALSRSGPSYVDIVEGAGVREMYRPQFLVVHHHVADLGDAGAALLPVPVGRPWADLTLSVHESESDHDAALFAQLQFAAGADRGAIGRFVERLTLHLRSVVEG
ncbi:amino acid adenylation domain-containing protein [Rhodococcus sp. BP-316]|uniref:non-ribosomal peptide synthetase n=1 Tax=Rhodococcus sp. BP-316 TaxID=2739445 RepID=UPI001C9ADA4C|nr:non-ribosomal peptide synthetase [Rhodococcus sp. BP-316]MBY6683156.1 amino acid adenylation domain-containing protein [Rhodococcus sp. BP-316]